MELKSKVWKKGLIGSHMPQWLLAHWKSSLRLQGGECGVTEENVQVENLGHLLQFGVKQRLGIRNETEKT